MATTKLQYIPALKWHAFTVIYDKFIAISMPEKEVKQKVIEEAKIEEREKVLDFGCGTGTSLQYLEQLKVSIEIYGYDVDPKILELAQNKGLKHTKLVFGDSLSLPFEDQYFDKIISTWVFHHLTKEAKEESFKELKRVLKKNGKLIIADWGSPSGKLMSFLFFILQLVDNFKTTNDNRHGKIPAFLISAGFKDVKELAFRNTIFGTLRYWKANA